MSARYTPLRGRIIIRPTGSSYGYGDQLRKLGLQVPDTYEDDPRTRKNQNSLGRGIVVAMGPPARDKWGREVVPGFQVGDEVLHIGQHKSRDVEWNGEMCRACSQEEVCAVLERDDFAALADTEPPPSEFGTEGMSE